MFFLSHLRTVSSYGFRLIKAHPMAPEKVSNVSDRAAAMGMAPLLIQAS